MTQLPDRRILTYPAVPSCECVSPSTLLHALIPLARTISSHQSRSFAAHRRNARQTIRQVEILLIFFEEIRNCRCYLSKSVALSFSELYVALQKISYLLEDCAREGTRLWILMQSEQVTNAFRIFIRTVATALDVLPMASIDVPAEVREMVELVMKQAWNVKVDIDPGDEQAAKDVHVILRAFENRIVPNSDDLRHVLDHLKICSWNKCNDEIKFLEEEIEFENSKGGERDTTLLCSLMGFLSYCRAVLFDVVDCRSRRKRSDCRHEGDVLSRLYPEDYRCPISLELMTDPVMISTGQTYDRGSIQKWFKAGNLICPKTGEKLRNTDLIPNIALHKLIQQYCYDNGIANAVTETSNRCCDLGRTLWAGSTAAAESIRTLAAFLAEKLSTGTAEERNKAAYEIRLLSKSSIFNRATIVEAGVILWLLLMLSSTDPSTQENAIAALLNLSKYCKGKTLIFETGGLGPIVDVLRNGLKMEARQSAAATVFYLSSVDEYRETIGKMPEAIPALVGLIRSGTNRGKKNAVVALFGLLLFAGNHRSALAAGIIPSLINLLTSERGDLVDDSLGLLAILAENPEGTLAIVRASAIPRIIEILHSSTSQVGKEYCVSVLLSLSINGGAEVVSILQKMPSLMESLYSVLVEGTSRASKKASSLLHRLHNFQSSGASGILPPSARQEHAVHVW